MLFEPLQIVHHLDFFGPLWYLPAKWWTKTPESLASFTGIRKPLALYS
jgi:hypothetical protein